MFAVRKRRIPHYWSLPVVVAIMSLAVVKLTAWQRAELISALAQQVAHSETDEAMAAVRQLAAMPRPPLARLVEAAVSPNLRVAEEAQYAVDGYLRVCQRHLEEGRSVRVVAAQMAVLAAALAHHQPSFSVADYPWLERATRSVLHLANRIPSRTTPLLAVHCDEILAAIGADASQSGSLSATPAADRHTILAENTFNAVYIHEPNPAQVRRDQHMLELLARPWSEDAAGTLSHPATSSAQPAPQQRTASVRALDFSVSLLPQSRGQFPDFVSAGDALAGWRGESADESSWEENHNSRSTFHSLSAQPVTVLPVSRADELTAAQSNVSHTAEEAFRTNLQRRSEHTGRGSPRNDVPDSKVARKNFRPAQFAPFQSAANSANHRLAGIQSRELMERWLVAEGDEADSLELELTHRGFGKVAAEFVQLLLSDQPADRLRLVDEVLADSSADGRAWLLLLADDPDADVRLAVVTILATSNDAALIEKAWQVAIRDRDPRIAGMASRLRDRRR